MARTGALETLASGIGLEITDATLKLIREKIQQLRSSFSNELNLLQKSQKSGVGTDDLYVPKWKWFGRLQFLVPHVTRRPERNNIDKITQAPEMEQPAATEAPEIEQPAASQGGEEDSPPSPRILYCSGDMILLQDLGYQAHEAASTSSTQSEPSVEIPSFEQDVPNNASLVKDILEEVRANRKRKYQETSPHHHFVMDICGLMDRLDESTAMAMKKDIMAVMMHYM